MATVVPRQNTLDIEPHAECPLRENKVLLPRLRGSNRYLQTYQIL